MSAMLEDEATPGNVWRRHPAEAAQMAPIKTPATFDSWPEFEQRIWLSGHASGRAVGFDEGHEAGAALECTAACLWAFFAGVAVLAIVWAATA